MASQKTRLRLLAPALALVALTVSAQARTPVAFSGVEASYHAGDAENLKLTIDGRNASAGGWSVGGRFETPQAVVFTTAQPVEADLIELSLCFMSGRPHASFADFVVSFTTDASPSLDGNWEPLPVLNLSATTCELTRGPGDHLLAGEVSSKVTGMIPDDIYRISSRLLGKSVTGFRIEVFPVLRAMNPSDGPVMAWAATGQFVLTEFQVEMISTSTNVALGTPVTASHPLYKEMTADSLTDGWPSTLAHPTQNVPIEDFHFEIDLGRQRIIDHLGLRQRGDHYNPDRFGKMRIKLYDQDPKTGAAPTWQAFNRPDGSFPAQGEVDVLRAADGQGEFHGRYLRISSEKQGWGAPQLAEVEVYETRTPRLVAVMVDGQALPEGSRLRIPPGVLRLGFQFEIPGTGRPYDRLYRWKVTGQDKPWQTSDSLQLEIPCPPPGDFQLEIQAAHSDGTWDASVLKMPLVVEARFTQTPAFLWLIGCGTLFSGVMVSRQLARRNIRRLEARSALEAERSRIAANMHDDVGARLAQLAVLHDVFAMEHALPPAASTDLATLTAGTREAMASLDEAVWTVNPRNDTLAALATYLMQHADSYLSPLGIACRIKSPNEWPDTPLRAGTRHEVALAFKEALQNIVKHAAASAVEITLRRDAGQFIVRVADNGRGLPVESADPGQDGLINMRQRLESIRGTCEWFPRESGGTVVEMKFPLS